MDQIASELDPELVAEVLAAVPGTCRRRHDALDGHPYNAFRPAASSSYMKGLIHEIGPPGKVFASPNTPERRHFLGVD